MGILVSDDMFGISHLINSFKSNGVEIDCTNEKAQNSLVEFELE